MKRVNINETNIRRMVSESVKKLLSENINTPQDLISLLGGNSTKAVFNIISILNFLKKNGVIGEFNNAKIRDLLCGTSEKQVDRYGIPSNFGDDSESEDFDDFDREYGGMSRL